MIISKKTSRFVKMLLIVSAVIFRTDMAFSQATEEGALDEMGTAIGNCFNGDPKMPKDAYAIINFKLDASAQIIGLPELVSKGEVDANTRRLFLLGVLALDDCAPYPSADSEVEYEVMFDPFSMVALWPAKQGADAKPSTTLLSPTAEEMEKALELTKSDRREVQQRLNFLGYDVGGADGVLGKKSRDAITSWQIARVFSVSGYLDDIQWAALKDQDNDGFQTWKAENPPPKPRRLRRVKVCRKIGLGLRKCRYEYR